MRRRGDGDAETWWPRFSLSPRHPLCSSIRSCGREVRHLVVNQADDGSSPFSSAMRQ